MRVCRSRDRYLRVVHPCEYSLRLAAGKCIPLPHTHTQMHLTSKHARPHTHSHYTHSHSHSHSYSHTHTLSLSLSRTNTHTRTHTHTHTHTHTYAHNITLSHIHAHTHTRTNNKDARVLERWQLTLLCSLSLSLWCTLAGVSLLFVDCRYACQDCSVLFWPTPPTVLSTYTLTHPRPARAHHIHIDHTQSHTDEMLDPHFTVHAYTHNPTHMEIEKRLALISQYIHTYKH